MATFVALVLMGSLSGCSGEMSKQEACSARAEQQKAAERGDSEKALALADDLLKRAPEPMRGYLVDFKEWGDNYKAVSGQAIVTPEQKSKEIADRHGFDQNIFCSS